MGLFTRKFPIGGEWGDIPGWAQESWVRQLFEHWTLPGMRGDEHALRIGIRNNYLNLYARGQSVSALRIAAGKPTMRISETYLLGKKNKHYRQPSPTVTAASDDLRPENVDRWIETALTFAGDEKRFVENLIAANPNVIDLEMALSTPDSPHGRNLSRMDLVVVEQKGGSPQLAFWEAKCANNSELRARGEIEISSVGKLISGPHAAEQLGDYKFKMEDPVLRTRIGNQYREAARILCSLCAAFDKGTPPEAWSLLANWNSDVGVIGRPGLVIGNYVPDGSQCSDDFAHMAKTFVDNGHHDKLTSPGYVLDCYDECPPLSRRLRSLA